MQCLFVSKEWFSDGMFSMLVDEVNLDYPSLANLIGQVQRAKMIDVVIDTNRVWYSGCMWVYEFGGVDIPVRVQTCYIDLLTQCDYADYTYKYLPGLKMVCVVNLDDVIIGFVMRVKNKGEW